MNEVVIHVRSKDETGHGFSSAKKAASGLGGAIKGIGTAAAGFLVGGAVATGLAKLTEGFGKSVEAASNLGESVNAIQKVFGTSSKVVEDWAKKNATSFGLSTRAFNELATPLGAGLKNAGLSMQDTSKWTIDLTKRAADMASVFNTDVGDAMEAVQAGLRGESDPLERYGVGLSAAAVQAEAMAETGKKAASALTNQETVTARLNLIMKQTASTQGDFAGTSNGLANSQRIAAAKTEELQAQIGQKLIPVSLLWTKVKLRITEVLATKLVPALQVASAWIGPRLSAGIQSSREWFERNRQTIETVVSAYLRLQGKVIDVAVWMGRHLPGAIRDTTHALGNVWHAGENTVHAFGNIVHAAGNVVHASGNVIHAIGNIIHAFGNIIHAVGNVVHAIGNVAHAFGNVGRAVDGAIAKINSFLGLNAKWQKSSTFGSQLAAAIGPATSRGNAFAHGGIVGAATGGIRSGLTRVGERGEELLQLPPGTRVRQTGTAPSGGLLGALTNVVVELRVTGNSDDLLVKWFRKQVRTGVITV